LSGCSSSGVLAEDYQCEYPGEFDLTETARRKSKPSEVHIWNLTGACRQPKTSRRHPDRQVVGLLRRPPSARYSFALDGIMEEYWLRRSKREWNIQQSNCFELPRYAPSPTLDPP
jgi:hypothetical protein